MRKTTKKKMKKTICRAVREYISFFFKQVLWECIGFCPLMNSLNRNLTVMHESVHFV
ncbi:hypothetical protein HMPREF1987_02053 [Peptostreptococcaceae bacterium oral taxon 113 str. W5053]|nr:hypothetical protein HMPREF1987_02053 [Peptostreptococcaceae bacterium oral taxon 113 str. W5053]